MDIREQDTQCDRRYTSKREKQGDITVETQGERNDRRDRRRYRETREKQEYRRDTMKQDRHKEIQGNRRETWR